MRELWVIERDVWDEKISGPMGDPEELGLFWDTKEGAIDSMRELYFNGSLPHPIQVNGHWGDFYSLIDGNGWTWVYFCHTPDMDGLLWDILESGGDVNIDGLPPQSDWWEQVDMEFRYFAIERDLATPEQLACLMLDGNNQVARCALNHPNAPDHVRAMKSLAE